MPKSEKYAIGVDLGGTFIKFGIVSAIGKIVHKTFLETNANKGSKYVIREIKNGINELLNIKGYKISGVGIGSPGVVQTKKGTIENPPNFHNWGKVHLGKLIKKEIGIKVFVENDANAAAIGEMIFGAGRNINSFLMVTLGTGVGGGIILNRKLYRGDSGGAGEIGHISIDYSGNHCNCGSIGCIEAYIGNNYLLKNIKSELNKHPESKILKIIDNNIDLLSTKVISEASKQDDKYAESIIQDVGKLLGCALSSACNLLDISNVIVGGGVSGFGNLLLESIESTMKKRVVKSLQSKIKIIPAKLKNDAGIKGASSLVFYKA
jgi:glucokinase